jgi:hypothetical protein
LFPLSISFFPQLSSYIGCRTSIQVNIRARTFKKALEVGAAYKIHTQAVLIRAAMIKANMQVCEIPTAHMYFTLKCRVHQSQSCHLAPTLFFFLTLRSHCASALARLAHLQVGNSGGGVKPPMRRQMEGGVDAFDDMAD